MKHSIPLTFAAAAFLAGAGRAGDPLFDTNLRSFHTGDQDTSQGYRPESIRLADLDGDGDLDVAIANNGNFIAPKATVLVNQGDGSFAPPAFFPLGWETDDLAAGDVDGDGDIDLVFGQSDYGISGQQVSVLINRGDATFEPERTFPCGLGPSSVALADVDGDGDLDAITANSYWNEHDVSVLYNDGAGNFGARVDFPLGAQPRKLVAGDLTGDGYPDLAVTVLGTGPNLLVLANDGAGGFGAPVGYDPNPSAYDQGSGVAMVDIDNDGDLDVLVSESDGTEKVAVLTNDGSGRLAVAAHLVLPYAFGRAYDIAAGDVTGDGWADILAVNHSSKYGYALIASNGAGGFQAARAIRTGEMARSIAPGDADGDGDLDVFVANAGSSTVTVHENDGGLAMPPDHEVTTGAREVGAADLDGDGDEDVVTAEYGVSTFFSDGNGGFTVQAIQPGLGKLQALELSDVDLDGDPDLVLLDDSPPYEFHVLLNDGAGNWGTPASYVIGSCGPGDIIAEDYDEDGDPDMVITEYLGCPGSGPEKLWLWSNNGSGGFFFHSMIGSYSITQGEQLAAGDFDEDGHVDLITTHPDSIGFWKGHGNGTFDVAVMADIGDWGPKFLTTGDFDGDGHLDVATSNFGNSFAGESISVLRGYGDGGFRVPQVYYAMFSLQYGNCAGIEAVDIDLDGHLDLIAGAYGADDLVLLRSRGDGTFRPQERYGVSGVVRYVKAAHLNGDGIPDVALSIGKEPPIQPAMTFLFGQPATDIVNVYCTAQTNSQGCVPRIGASGTASASAGSGFLVTAEDVLNNKNGLLFYGKTGRASAPFQGGTLCVRPPLRRTQVAGSGGNPPPNDCSGLLARDFNAVIAAGVDPALVAGQMVWCQWWSRDLQSPSGTNLTDALEFMIGT